MGIMNKLKGVLGQHPDKVKEAVEKGGDMIDKRTGGKYSDKVDKVQEKADEYIDREKG